MSITNTNTNRYTNSNVMPQVAHKNIVSKRNWVNQSINFMFNVVEIIVMVLLFASLYFYRLSEEFGLSLWDEYGLTLRLPRFFEYTVFFLVLFTIWVAWLYHFKMFSLKGDISVSLFDEFVRVIKAISYSVLLTIGIAFVFKLEDYSRFVILSFWFLSILFSIGLRGLKHLVMLTLAKQGLLVKNVVIIGAGKVGVLILKELSRNISTGYRVVGFIDDEKKGKVDEVPVLGRFDDLERVIQRHPVDELIVTIPTERELVHQFLNEFRKYDFTIRIVPEMFNLVSKTIQIENVNSIPYITLIKTPMRGLPYLLKRGLDFLLTFVGLIFISPLLLLVGILIKLDSPGPIIYKQRRVGKDGKFFYMYKFRSMVQHADQLKGKLKELNDMDEVVFKMKDDPRVTRVGRFIRKYSIDELPQLFNVLKGEMSLVGPRPPLPLEVEQYNDWQWRRMEVVPGITGLWQVSGRSELSFEQWVNLDIYYIENWNLLMDFKILLKTIPAVIKGEGAY